MPSGNNYKTRQNEFAIREYDRRTADDRFDDLTLLLSSTPLYDLTTS
jgi:hypothetical protein